MPLERKIQLADDIVDNTNGEAECFAQVRALMTRILEPAD
jgi:dephospho-CoA kinase